MRSGKSLNILPLLSNATPTVKEGPLPDFTGFRLDWFRLQAYTSISRATLVLGDNTELARTMNTIIFHTLMVDAADEVLQETSDLSIFW